jgi:aspartate carbamoyltransferase catalytic subunit
MQADVVMMLRMQRERHEGLDYSFDDYVRDFGLTSEKLEKHAPNAILMHPGPVNRDVEISSELLDSPKGVTILEQAQNGTFVRMAVLQEVLNA